MFRVAPRFTSKTLEEIFRQRVFKMLLSKGKITEDLVDMLMRWRHSGFNVFCGPRIQPGEEEAMENLARYIIRASFSQERMTYISEESKVVYKSKDGRDKRAFDSLEWLAAMCSHVPNKGEQMVRYYGYVSNVSRGKRKKNDQDELIPSILEPAGSSREYRKNWARLIQKIYEVDPLTCPKCKNEMYIGFHQRPGGHKENPQASGALGSESQAATQSYCKSTTFPDRLLRFSGTAL